MPLLAAIMETEAYRGAGRILKPTTTTPWDVTLRLLPPYTLHTAIEDLTGFTWTMERPMPSMTTCSATGISPVAWTAGPSPVPRRVQG